jgi:uncharacterized membrane protein YecN with MAPEG domain
LETGTLILIITILVLPWLLLLAYLLVTNMNILKIYKSLANKYGFEVDSSKKSGFFSLPTARGKYRDVPVEIGSFIKEEGRKKSSATYINVDCLNASGLDFTIVKKNSANKINYGANAFAISDAEFDRKFIINTNDTKRMFELLNFSIKYKLLQSLNVGFNGVLRLNGNKLEYIEKKLIKNSFNLLRIEILLHLLCEFADELKRNES